MTGRPDGLGEALSQIAASVDDDRTTDRMHGQVRTMVTRVRRRRAARRAAHGAVGLGAAAATALVAAGPGQAPRTDPAGPPPVTGSAVPTGPVLPDPAPCGAATGLLPPVSSVPGIPADGDDGTGGPQPDSPYVPRAEPGLALSVLTPAEGVSGGEISVVVSAVLEGADDDTSVDADLEQPVVAVLDSDGVVVGVPSAIVAGPGGTVDLSTGRGGSNQAAHILQQHSAKLLLVSCATGEALAPGPYTMLVRLDGRLGEVGQGHTSTSTLSVVSPDDAVTVEP